MAERLRGLYASPDLHAFAIAAASWGARLLVALLILGVGWWLARRLADGVQRMLARGGADPLLGHFLRNLVLVLLLAVVATGALDRIGVPTASLLAALGAAGLAIGLALQGSLSNLAAGVLLMAFRPFRVGDSVQAAGLAGTVQRVTLMHTILHTPDHCEVVVPNARIAAEAIVNYSALGTRRIDLVVRIGYADDIGTAFDAARAALAGESRVLSEPAAEVAVLELGDTGVQLAVRAWVRSSDHGAVRSALLRALKESLGAAGIVLPVPQPALVPRDARG
jgi:small conductance mechanosensitive channel